MTRALLKRTGLENAPRWVTNTLDSRWFWHAVAYAGLGVVSVLLWVNYTRVAATQRKQSVEDSSKAAQILAQHVKTRAAAEAAFARCETARPLLIRINRFITGEREASRILVINSQALLLLSHGTAADHEIRKANLARLRKADAKVQAAPKLHVPTKQDCRDARNKLLIDGGLPPSKRP